MLDPWIIDEIRRREEREREQQERPRLELPLHMPQESHADHSPPKQSDERGVVTIDFSIG